MIIREMILFSLLCLGALFFNSSEFVDTGIVPKWYMTIAMGIVLVVYYLILSQRKRSFSFEMQGIIYAIIISCALQALYGILQYWGVLQCTSSFRITGSFDNPAGFASSDYPITCMWCLFVRLTGRSIEYIYVGCYLGVSVCFLE